MNTIGAIVKQRREMLSLTQTALSKRTQGRVTQPGIVQLEMGQNTNPKISTLEALATALDCALVDLLPEKYKRPRQAPPQQPRQAA